MPRHLVYRHKILCVCLPACLPDSQAHSKCTWFICKIRIKMLKCICLPAHNSFLFARNGILSIVFRSRKTIAHSWIALKFLHAHIRTQYPTHCNCIASHWMNGMAHLTFWSFQLIFFPVESFVGHMAHSAHIIFYINTYMNLLCSRGRSSVPIALQFNKVVWRCNSILFTYDKTLAKALLISKVSARHQAQVCTNRNVMLSAQQCTCCSRP